MKKILYIVTGLLFSAFSAHNALAADVTTGTGDTDAGKEVVITAGVSGAQDIRFRPSTNVYIIGTTSSTLFAVGAYHQQALLTDTGQGYGMASDSNKMFWISLKAGAPTITLGASNAYSSFSTWHTM